MKMMLNVLLITELIDLSSALIKQHYFVDQTKTWYAAKVYCTTFYHDLSSFTDPNEENQFLTEATDQTSDAWIGLHTQSGVWMWSGGENAAQLTWNISDGVMTNYDYADTNCALLQRKNKKLIKERCTDEHAFFCMTRFAVVRENETWEGALEHCRKHYSDLGSLSSVFRMNSSLEMVRQTQVEYVWTALCFLAGDWLWVTGDEMDFMAWPHAGPPRCPDLRCGALDKQTGVWVNRDCEETLNFICQ